jgi:hypothetical protein
MNDIPYQRHMYVIYHKAMIRQHKPYIGNQVMLLWF